MNNENQHQQAFNVAKALPQPLIDAVYTALNVAMQNGDSFAEFQKRLFQLFVEPEFFQHWQARNSNHLISANLIERFSTASSEVMLDRAQAKEKLRKMGVSTKQWAKENGFDYSITINVLNGANKGYRGQAHKVAVALGIKETA